MKKILLLGVALFSLSVQTWAKVTTENRTVGAFDKVAVEGVISLNLKQGNESKVSVETDSAWQKSLKVEVKNGTLMLLPSAEMRAANKHSIVNVSYKELKSLKFIGNEKRVGSNVRFSNALRGDSLSVHLEGINLAKLDYDVKSLNLNVDGINSLRLYGNSDELSMKKSRVKVLKNSVEDNNGSIKNNRISIDRIFEGGGIGFGEAVVAIVVVLGIFFAPFAAVVLIVYFIVRGQRNRQRRREELYLKAIEMGKEAPVVLLADRKKSCLNSGITWTMIGVGIALFFGLASGGEVEAVSIGAIPFCVGVAYLLKYYLGEKEK